LASSKLPALSKYKILSTSMMFGCDFKFCSTNLSASVAVGSRVILQQPGPWQTRLQ
jgi:hypothetical protein